MANQPTKNPDPRPRRKAGALLWTQRILGRVLGITFIVGGVVTTLVLASELEDQPRTEDAYVRANVIGIAAHVSGEILLLCQVLHCPPLSDK